MLRTVEGNFEGCEGEALDRFSGASDSHADTGEADAFASHAIGPASCYILHDLAGRLLSHHGLEIYRSLMWLNLMKSLFTDHDAEI